MDRKVETVQENLGQSEPPGQTPHEGTPPPGKVNNKHVAAGTHEEGVLYMNEEHCAQVMHKLKTQRENGVMCDVKLLINGSVEICAHKCVLSANSPVFCGPGDSNTNTFPLTVPNIKSIEAIIDYMYTGQISVGIDSASDLLTTAKKLNMDDVRQCCSMHLEKIVDIANWKDILKLSELHSLEALCCAVGVFLATNIMIICQDEHILNISEAMLESVLKQSNINMDSDIEIFALDLLMTWTAYDVNIRLLSFPKLLQAIRPELIKKDSLDQLLQKAEIRDSQLVNDPLLGDFINIVYENSEKVNAQPEESNSNIGQEYDENKLLCEQTAETKHAIKEEVTETNIGDGESDDGTDKYNPEDEGEPGRPEGELMEQTVHVLSDERQPRNRKAIKPFKISGSSTPVAHEVPVKRGRGRPRKHPLPGQTQADVKVKAKTKTKTKAVPKKRTKSFGTQTIEDNIKEETIDAMLDWGYNIDGDDLPANVDSEAKVPKVRSKRKKACKDGAKEPKVYKCPKCDREFPTYRLKHRHVVRSHGQDEPFLCDICGFTTKHVDTIRLHKNKHKGKTEGRVHACTKCDKVFKTSAALSHHQHGHGTGTPLLCELCGFTSKYSANMAKHRRTHEGKTLKCTFPGCTYENVRRGRLEDHMSAHNGIKNHVCSVCGKAFSGRKHMQRHEKIHLDVKPISCEQCEWKTTRRDKLRAHIRRHHSDWALMTGYASLAEIEKAKLPEPPRPKRVREKRKRPYKPKVKSEAANAPSAGTGSVQRSGFVALPTQVQGSTSTISEEMLSYLSTVESTESSSRIALPVPATQATSGHPSGASLEQYWVYVHPNSQHLSQQSPFTGSEH